VADPALDLRLGLLTPSLAGGTDYAVGSTQSGTTLFNSAGSACVSVSGMGLFGLFLLRRRYCGSR
jgi:hypothetical protein